MKYVPMLLFMVACSSPTAMSPIAPASELNISGSVTTFQVVPAFSFESDYRNINYVVTTSSSRAVSGCYVEVKWLDGDGVQVAFTFASTDAVIPQGVSTMTNQDYIHKDKSSLIKDSLVEYSLCR